MKRVFLSFAPEDILKVKDLLPLFTGADYELDFCQIPPDADFEGTGAESIKRAIGVKIVNSRLTVCLIGEETHKSKWVNCELKKSRDKGNRIIAMALKRVESAVLPEVVREENLKFYPWDAQKLKKLIQEEPDALPPIRDRAR